VAEEWSYSFKNHINALPSIVRSGAKHQWH